MPNLKRPRSVTLGESRRCNRRGFESSGGVVSFGRSFHHNDHFHNWSLSGYSKWRFAQAQGRVYLVIPEKPAQASLSIPLSDNLPQPTEPAFKADDLLPLVYDQLRSLATQRMAQEAAGHTLQATALVHEVFLRLQKSDEQFSNRAHFFWAAAEAMRRILIEHARSKQRLKRGGASQRQMLNVLDLAASPASEDAVAFDEAIEHLHAESPQAAAVVRLRFYAGLSVDETAEALSISARTVSREWTYARAWLFRQLGEGSE